MKILALTLNFLFFAVVAFAGPPSAPQVGGTGVTADGSVPFTGELTVDELGIEFQETDTLTDCSTFAATGGGIFFDDSEGIFKKCQDNVLTDMDTGGGNVSDNTAEAISGIWEIQDNTAFNWGDDGDWTFRYDETTGDQLEIYSTNVAADTTIDIQNTDATYKANVNVDGTVTAEAFATSGADGEHYLNVSNSTVCSALSAAGDLCYDVDDGVWRYWLTDATSNWILTNVHIGAAGGTQAYDANLPTWPSTVDATEVGYLNGLTEALSTSLAAKAPLASPTFTGTVGAAAIAATGTINGLVEVTLDTAATASPTCDGEWRFNDDNDVIDYTLPGAAAGLVCCFGSNFAAVVTVDVADGVDTITLDGTTLTAGYAIDSAGAASDFACLIGLDATRWKVMGKSGTWVDGGAD